MSELKLASRREADKCIREGRVLVDGQLVRVGQKVDPTLTTSQIEIMDDENSHAASTMPAVILHKPMGHVSGQAEHDHVPAIRLLTRENLWNQNTNSDDEFDLPFSWKGYAPAGRLDVDSTGLLVFCHSGVLAKQLVGNNSGIDKEYIVHVEPAHQVSRRERERASGYTLPPPTMDLQVVRQGGGLLEGDDRPLKPCKAKWIEQGRTLNLQLKEGRKHQIRRMCRELLGYHVVGLERTRIGPIELQGLPEGQWRPITQQEVDAMLATTNER
jgi:23S rRNA pseudouridine2604 synthase